MRETLRKNEGILFFSHFGENVEKEHEQTEKHIQVFTHSVHQAGAHAFIHAFAKHTILYVLTPSLTKAHTEIHA